MEYLIGRLILFGEIWQEVGFIFIRKKAISQQYEVQYGILCEFIAGSWHTAEWAEADKSLHFFFQWSDSFYWVPPFKMYLLILFLSFVNSLWGFLLVFLILHFFPACSFLYDQFLTTSWKFQNRFSSYIQYEGNFWSPISHDFCHVPCALNLWRRLFWIHSI